MGNLARHFLNCAVPLYLRVALCQKDVAVSLDTLAERHNIIYIYIYFYKNIVASDRATDRASERATLTAILNAISSETV